MPRGGARTGSGRRRKPVMEHVRLGSYRRDRHGPLPSDPDDGSGGTPPDRPEASFKRTSRASGRSGGFRSRCGAMRWPGRRSARHDVRGSSGPPVVDGRKRGASRKRSSTRRPPPRWRRLNSGSASSARAWCKWKVRITPVFPLRGAERVAARLEVAVEHEPAWPVEFEEYEEVRRDVA
jgi:hypothetical protein